jgi:methionyl-tRNA formyltransferase
MTQPAYIIASCKAWHREEFEKIEGEFPNAKWLWVTTTEELVAALTAGSARYVFFIHWNFKVPESVWSAIECVCFHMTDVPYGRGGSPLQNLIVAGHKVTKLSALRMVEELDAGPVYAKQDLDLAGRAEDIYLRAGRVSFDIVRRIIREEPVPLPQQGTPVVFKRRQPWQSELPREGDLGLLYDHIRMLDAPTYPLAFVDHGEFRCEFASASLEGDELIAKVRIRRRTER